MASGQSCFCQRVDAIRLLCYRVSQREKAKNARTQILNTDAYFRGLLNRCGYDLRIIETKKGKIHFRIVILPFEQEA